MSLYPDETWVALASLTETEQPHELPFVQQVIVNRMRRGGKRREALAIVTEKWQFSWFNGRQGLSERELYATLRKEKGLGPDDARGNLEQLARLAAVAVLGLPPECGILPEGAHLFWSPRSMVPAGSLPRGWDWSIVWCFTLPGVDAHRFVFGAEVGKNDRRAGNAWSLNFHGQAQRKALESSAGKL